MNNNGMKAKPKKKTKKYTGHLKRNNKNDKIHHKYEIC